MMNMDENEEWNNFIRRILDVSCIITGLTSENTEIAENAQIRADKYLCGKNDIPDENVDVKFKCDRTLINKRNDDKVINNNPNEMDCESFMRIVGRDADERAADKKVRMERAETFKTRAAKAFQRGDYDLALSCYDRAIEQIKDSCLLYTNRALTLIKLKKYDKVLDSIVDVLKSLWQKIATFVKFGLGNEKMFTVVKEILSCMVTVIIKKIPNLHNASAPFISCLIVWVIQYFFERLMKTFNADQDNNNTLNV